MRVNIRPSVNPQAQAPLFQRGASAQAARKDDVLELIDNNYDRFDRDGNGRITWTEMRKNVADPTITGQDAAALATLYSLMQGKGEELGRVRPLVLTPEIWDDIKDDMEFAKDEGEAVASDLYYERYLTKLENASNELFPQGLPDGMQVRQGFGPSCAILSTTVGQALLDPLVIKEAVTEREDGKVSVKFPGLSKPITINATTDTETALFATAGENGTWINHVEKAWGTTQTKTPGAAFEMSSWPAKSIRAWTNGQATTTSVPKDLKSYKQGEYPDFLRQAADGLEKGWIVMTWTRNGERELGDLVPGHAHTLLGIDAEQGTVSVRNPWGHKEPTDEHGKPRDGKDDGIFEVSLQEYVADFGRIALQTSNSKPGKRAR